MLTKARRLQRNRMRRSTTSATVIRTRRRHDPPAGQLPRLDAGVEAIRETGPFRPHSTEPAVTIP